MTTRFLRAARLGPPLLLPMLVITLAWTMSALAGQSTATSAEVYFPAPGDAWERMPPQEAGFDPELLREAVDFATANESSGDRDLGLEIALSFHREPFDGIIGPTKERGDPSGLVVRHGYIVAEWGPTERVDMTFSVTKSFLSTVVGLAFDRGLIPDLDRPVRELVPIAEFDSDHNASITWDDLLRQTSDWQGELWGKPDWADRPEGDDPAAWPKRPLHEPGTRWKYNDVRVNLLALAALHVWREPLPEVLREEVMDPIGASPTWRWHGYENSWIELDGLRVQSVPGGGHWGGGMFINARDMARFGTLLLRRGMWKDRRILSERWIEMASTPTPANPFYGFMNWFLNVDGTGRISSGPRSAVVHLGFGSNAIYVDRENDLVVVVRWIEGRQLNAFIEKVLAALQ